MNLKQAKKKITTKAKDIFIPEQTSVTHLRNKRTRLVKSDMVVKATQTPQGLLFTYDGEPYLVSSSKTYNVCKCSDCEYCIKSRELKKKRTAKEKRPEILEKLVCGCYNNCTEVEK